MAAPGVFKLDYFPTQDTVIPIGDLPKGPAGYFIGGNGASAPSYQAFAQTFSGAITQTWQKKVELRVDSLDAIPAALWPSIRNGTVATDLASYLAVLRTYVMGLTYPVRLIWPSGLYPTSVWPNFAKNDLEMIPEGHVALRYTAATATEAFVFDGGTGVTNMIIGAFHFEAPTTVTATVHCKNINHSTLDNLNVRGGGVNAPGFLMENCVLTDMRSPKCSVNEDSGWYSGPPKYALLIIGTSAAIPIYNPTFEGTPIGIDYQGALNCFAIGGTCEACSNTGMITESGSVLCGALLTDFEANGADIVMDGVSNFADRCATTTSVSIAPTAQSCYVERGQHGAISVALGALNCWVVDLCYNRSNNGKTFTDSSTTTIKRNIVNFGTGVVRFYNYVTGGPKVSIADGGTGTGTAQGARSSTSLNIDSLTGHGNSDYTSVPADRIVATVAAFTAPRTWTLPLANAVNAGQSWLFLDLAGAVGLTNTLTLAGQGGNLINGLASLVLRSPGSFLELWSDGASNWTFGVNTVPLGGTGIQSATANGFVLGNGALPFNVMAAMTDGQLPVGQTGGPPLPKTVSGDATLSAAGAITLASIIAAGGPIGSATVTPIITYDAKGRLTTVSQATIAPPFSAVTGTAAVNQGGTGGTTAANAAINLNVVARVRTQVFTGSGTYTPSAGLISAIIECIAGGGGGGGAAGGATSTQGGGGGGSGSYSRSVVTAAAVGASQTVTVGAAGTAGATGNNNGGNGGDTSVGSLCIAKGGAGGFGTAATVGGAGGLGGVAGTGDFTATGNSGLTGNGASITTVTAVGGNGAGSPVGGGMSQQSLALGGVSNGVAGTNYGSGGSGGATQATASTAAGAAGKAGVVIITEFCNQ